MSATATSQQNRAGRGVNLEFDGAIARIRFDRPDQLNAIDETSALLFLDACKEVAQRQKCRVVVLSGSGKAFVSGGDLQALSQNSVASAASVISPINQALRILDECPQPVIGMLHGVVAGAGIGLALASDFAIAAENTRFNLAYSKIGACLDGGTSWYLVRSVGLRKAMELAVRSPNFTAAQALEWGLVSEVVPADGLEAAVDALANELARGPTFAYGRIKYLLKSAHARPLAEHLALEQAAFCECAATVDFAEGIAAFREKRAPRFAGQ
jgi:2-(1,2-epoxy-1,2-dihydrophenyl)acetyl-CoA isomerase